MTMIITIDGPSGAGKSTVSKMVAKKLNCFYLDTGAMYRAVALKAKREGIDIKDGERLEKLCRDLDLRFKRDGEQYRLHLAAEDISDTIRSPEMDMLASRVSSIREVREAMTDLQRKIGSEGRLVAEGRDMGTVVFPEAYHKFYITASERVRAERRYRERLDRGEKVTRQAVERELKKRDEQDTNRSLAPLRPAEDAEVIETTALDLNQVVKTILRLVRKDP